MISDSDWIKANPERAFRIRPSERRESGYVGCSYPNPNIKAATVVRIAEDRRTWSRRNILVLGEIINNDKAAEHALRQFDDLLFPRLIDAASRKGAR